MNDYLNAQQLAFILDIKKEDARAKMCNAWCKANNIPKNGSMIAGAHRDMGKKIKDDYPQAMSIEMLATHPENELRKAKEAGKRKEVQIPPALKSLLPKETQDTILNEWRQRHFV